MKRYVWDPIKKKLMTTMKITESMYEYALQRIEVLIPLTDDSMPMDNPLMIEFDIMTQIVEDYENEHFPIHKPTIGQVIADAMYEMSITEKQLAEKLRVSPSRVSDYVNDKAVPTLRIARMLCAILRINPVEMLDTEFADGEPSTTDSVNG